MIYSTAVNSIRSSDIVNRIDPVAPYAHYPFQGEEGGKQTYSRDAWMKPALAAAASASEWLQETKKAQKTLNALLDYRTSAWQERNLTASDPKTIHGNAERGATIKTYIVEVFGLARTQRNQSYELAAKAGSVIEAGSHSFIMAAREQEISLSVTIEPLDTNAAALARVCTAVNQAGLDDVYAEVIDNKMDGTVSLALASSSSGKQGAFTVADAGGSIIAAIGLGSEAGAKEEAADAVYAIDGHSAISAQSNTALLDGGKVKLQLRGLTGSPVTVGIGIDSGAVVMQISETIAAITRLDRLFDAEPAYLKPSLRKELELAMASDSIGALGISRRPSGGWNLDGAKLTAAITTQPEAVQRQLTGRSGWAPAVARTLERFSQLPVQALLNPSAQMMQSYTAYQSTMLPYWQLPANGWYMNRFT